MNYQQTLDYLFSQLPMFQRIGAAAYKANLDNTIEICRITGNPQNSFRSVHIAGTNGKGSVSHLLASILQESGYKTALFTSPHLKDFRERMKINGEMVPEKFVCDFTEEYMGQFNHIKPSFFEMTFGMAMKWFSVEQVDIAVIETGMGGRLDSSNVITPLLSVITNIGLDHTQFLGNTLAEIAVEKGGIIKNGIPVVIGETQPETEEIFKTLATRNQSKVYFADQVVSLRRDIAVADPSQIYVDAKVFDNKKHLSCPLTGNYQLKNLATVLASAHLLDAMLLKPEKLNVENGIRNVIANTGFTGRWQVLKQKPLTICDIGHNPDGIKFIVDQIRSLKFKRLHFILGVVNDKDITSMLQLLPQNAIYYFCKADIPRGLDAVKLKETASAFKLKGAVYNSVKLAYNAALAAADDEDLVFIGGSAFTVAEIV